MNNEAIRIEVRVRTIGSECPDCGSWSSRSLHSLAAGIDRDRTAVIAGLTMPWSSGVVEGHVNRIKMLRRQMFGRAGFDLLRKRVLLYT